VGIPPAEAKRIFDPFYQVDNQDLTVESGMGMGLAVVKELVQLHHGRVWVESTPGEGSVFQVALPLTQEY
jgi:two-component system sensor histidine kinase VicK